jgi:hypothetical protein
MLDAVITPTVFLLFRPGGIFNVKAEPERT